MDAQALTVAAAVGLTRDWKIPESRKFLQIIQDSSQVAKSAGEVDGKDVKKTQSVDVLVFVLGVDGAHTVASNAAEQSHGSDGGVDGELDIGAGSLTGQAQHLPRSAVLGSADGFVPLLTRVRVVATELGLLSANDKGADGLADVLDNVALDSRTVAEVTSTTYTATAQRVAAGSSAQRATRDVRTQSRAKGSTARAARDGIADGRPGIRRAKSVSRSAIGQAVVLCSSRKVTHITAKGRRAGSAEPPILALTDASSWVDWLASDRVAYKNWLWLRLLGQVLFDCFGCFFVRGPDGRGIWLAIDTDCCCCC